MKKISSNILPVVVAVIVAGCSSVPLTTTKEATALDTALTRARFEMNCPEATGVVLSKQDVVARFGIERAEFTIGIEGCGKRSTSVVICTSESEGCFAADGGRR
jgi:ABC-type proline/glycine betaine transport system permease subunit